jgi:hypothetical protein
MRRSAWPMIALRAPPGVRGSAGPRDFGEAGSRNFQEGNRVPCFRRIEGVSDVTVRAGKRLGRLRKTARSSAKDRATGYGEHLQSY